MKGMTRINMKMMIMRMMKKRMKVKRMVKVIEMKWWRMMKLQLMRRLKRNQERML
jgi:hypothetical protein